MSEDFARHIAREGRLRPVSELPMGTVMEIDRTQIMIPECCREGWPSCPHIPKRQRKGKANIGL